jgi:tetratricopeptide (TPR) repeat protein
MGTSSRGGSRRALLLAALLVVAGPGGWLLGENARADGEADLRKKALALNELTGTAPIEGKLKQMFADEAGTKKLLAVAAKMMKQKPQPFNRNATLLLALAAENVNDVETSAAFYRLNALQSLRLFSERGLATAYLGLIQLYTVNKRFAESEKVCREFLALPEGDENSDLERFRPLVMRRLVLAVARQGGTDKALKIAEELIKADPRNWLNLELKAQVLRAGGKPEESARVYLDVIERVAKDQRLKKKEREKFADEYRYTLSGVYSEMNQVDKAAEQLKTLLAHEPDNPTYNNDLGFIWADKGVNLAEAEKYIRRAIEEDRKLRKKTKGLKPEEDKDNGAYLDSLGWVLFKQGKPKEARPYLIDAAHDKDGQHIEIYDHLGDVHMALGEKAEAIAAWKKALAHTTPSKRDQQRKIDVEKKLKSAQEK